MGWFFGLVAVVPLGMGERLSVRFRTKNFLRKGFDMPEVKRIDIDDFVRLGFLQEVNRIFFHPRGLALEANFENGKFVSLGGVWDYREDPEGISFGGSDLDSEESRIKARNVLKEFENHVPARMKRFGSPLQQIPGFSFF